MPSAGFVVLWLKAPCDPPGDQSPDDAPADPVLQKAAGVLFYRIESRRKPMESEILWIFKQTRAAVDGPPVSVLLRFAETCDASRCMSERMLRVYLEEWLHDTAY